ncbi:XrtA/PEP-CTERM system-associated ATPase [Thiohalorhabdus sp.]|uniref:XrtA/PEP-CTERM system-associated ATPase n=1 Tax=Thiohalorhabdus sp. TaxID=3094134 RepID=UPI002FC28CF3
MYERFYGLKGKPFKLTPDTRFYFNSKGHSRALDYLRYGIQQGEGFVVVTGGVGTGKTTLAQTLFNELRRYRNVVTAHLVMSQFEGDDLLELITDAFGLNPADRSQATLVAALEEFLRQQFRAKKRVILLLDEVQNLPFSGLEALRMLSNFQENQRPLIQSLLLGQAEFRDALQRPSMEQVRQRVVASCHLEPFSEQETRDYIEHRLSQAGWKGDPAIEPEVFHSIQDYTQGVPRRINTFCDRLLLFAFLEGVHQIQEQTVDSVAEEIAEDLPGSPGQAQSGRDEGRGGDDRVSRLEERVRFLEEALRQTRDGLDRAFADNPETGGEG